MNYFIGDWQMITELKEKILNGECITKDEALSLVEADLDELAAAADEIRLKFCGDKFDMCAVMNVKGGRCSEDCKFCSQSICSSAQVPTFPVREEDYVLADAKAHDGVGISHYCQVSSGRKMSKKDIGIVCKNVKGIVEETKLMPCVSLGLLNKDDLLMLKNAGVKRVHNNLETGKDYFKQVCSTHTYEEKMEVMRLAHEVGLELCSGGIFGIGETWQDRIEMAFNLKPFEPESVPINILNPVKGTPMGEHEPLKEEEVRRIIGIYRFILPKAFIRLAAGRGYLDDTGLKIFKSGCNATITGDMVTVKGISIEKDLENIGKLGYKF